MTPFRSRNAVLAVRASVCASITLVSGMLLADPAAGPAPAADAARRARVERLFEQGQAHYDLAEYEDAIARFREAYELSSAPLLLFNIAQAYRLKGECARALPAYRNFVRVAPDSTHRATAEEHVKKLQAECGAGDSSKVDRGHESDAGREPDARTASALTAEAPRDAGADGRSLVERHVAREEKGTGTETKVVAGLLATTLVAAGTAATLYFWNESR